MYLSEISITNFRNYRDNVIIDFSKGNNIFLGDNAQGKSNLLEAIYYLALAHSFRGAKDNDLINIDRDFFRLEGKIVRNDREQAISISFSQDKKKQYSLDGIKKKSLSDIIGTFTCVIFAPEHLQLVKGAPALRRRYLDNQIAQITPKYYRNLRDYKRILRQRNQVLKEGQDDQLDVWDKIICNAGTRIISARLRALDKLSPIIRENFAKISGEPGDFEVKYASTLGKMEYFPDERTIYEMYIEKIREKRSLELKTFSTIVGPHRDDFELLFESLPLKDFGSQGQQRMAVLAMKTAELNFIREYTGEWPVLLLDDVMSELDSKRRKYVLEMLTEVQTFITATDRSHFEEEFITGASVKNIAKGIIS